MLVCCVFWYLLFGFWVLLEVHVLNFSKDLYGQHVHITFLKKIRDEIKFESIDALKEQIKKDIINAEIFLKKYD